MECLGTASPSLCASGATINMNSNLHLHFSGLLKAEVNSLYHENNLGFFLLHSVVGWLTFQSSGLSGLILRGKTVSRACCALGSAFLSILCDLQASQVLGVCVLL